MADKSEMVVFFVAIAAVILLGMFLQKNYEPFAISGSETMTRTSSAITVNPSSTFQIVYTAVGTSGTWGASIEDSVTNCKFPDGTNSLKTVMLSSDGLTKTITMTAPSSGSCVFSNGNYKYGTSPILNFAPLTVTICSPTCTRPTDLCLITSSNGCGGTCTWTITKNTPADTDCNNAVDRTELGVYINNWIAGTVTRDNLGAAIVAWIGTG